MKIDGFDNCKYIGNKLVCTKEMNGIGKTVGDDIREATITLVRPQLTQDEAVYMETNMVVLFFNSLTMVINTAFAFYVYYLLASFGFFITGYLWLDIILILLVFTTIILLLSFIQYRALKAIRKTRIIERMASELDETNLFQDES